MANKLNAFIWRAGFTIVYTATVLPFTVNFFNNIANPSTAESLMFVLPLTDIHALLLPFFLAGLEFASVGLACSLWQRQNINKMLIVLLFLGCQLFPITALYYDVRSKDWQEEKSTYERSKKEKVDALTGRVRSLNEQISMLSGDISERNQERREGNRAINELLRIRRNARHTDEEDIRTEFWDRKKLREQNEGTVARLLGQKESLQADLKKREDELQFAQSQTVPAGDIFGYIVRGLFSYKSLFTAFIAFLLPISLLSVAFVLPKNSSTTGERPLFDLQAHLKNASAIPESQHYNYARLLVPSIDAYISAFKASKIVAIENDYLHLQNALVGFLIQDVGMLQKQIADSKLEENAKSYLLTELNGMLNNQLTQKEEMSHV